VTILKTCRLVYLAAAMSAVLPAARLCAADAAPATGPVAAKTDPVLADLKAQIERLQAESQMRQQKLEAELASIKAENERLKAAAELAAQKQKTELDPLVQEKSRLETQAALNKAKRDASQAPVNEQLESLKQQQQLREAQLASELAEMKTKSAKLTAQAELEATQNRLELAKLQQQQQVLVAGNAIESEKLRALSLATEATKAKEIAELAVTQAKVQQRDSKDLWRSQVNDEIKYRKNPFAEGVLYISDRRIDLSGPIITGVADYICNRIDYFNNQSSEDPIFIVIDNCPGGSVMQGYRIVKAIESSKAPVHVVVRSFAASMAAVITTLAPHSYAYPNAIILHHQMSSFAYGNMTDIEEEVQTLKEWERRLAEPVAAKMGISVEEFKKKMYSAKKSGDWDEFADKAVKLKWVDSIVTEIREEGVRKKPTDAFPKPWWWAYFCSDEHGQSYVNLPVPEPKDAYMLYNPNRFYRVNGK